MVGRVAVGKSVRELIFLVLIILIDRIEYTKW
jgi:hypothetical protein